MAETEKKLIKKELEITGFEGVYEKEGKYGKYQQNVFYVFAPIYNHQTEMLEYVDIRASFNSKVGYEPTWIQSGKKILVSYEYKNGIFNGYQWEMLLIDTDSLKDLGLITKEDIGTNKRERYDGYVKK